MFTSVYVLQRTGFKNDNKSVWLYARYILAYY